MNRVPLILILLTIGISLTGLELFPFSKFPMYSSFPAEATYYYLSDENNKPIALKPDLNLYSDDIKKSIEARYYSLQESDPNTERSMLLERAARAYLLEILRSKRSYLKKIGKTSIKLWSQKYEYDQETDRLDLDSKVIAQWETSV